MKSGTGQKSNTAGFLRGSPGNGSSGGNAGILYSETVTLDPGGAVGDGNMCKIAVRMGNVIVAPAGLETDVLYATAVRAATECGCVVERRSIEVADMNKVSTGMCASSVTENVDFDRDVVCMCVCV
jgi:hypothetical protein